MLENTYIASFNPYHIYLLRKINPNIPCCLLYCASICEWYYKEKNQELLIPSYLAYSALIRILDYFLL